MLNINKYHKMFGLGILPRIIPVFFIFQFFISNINYIRTQENLVPNGSFEEYDTCPQYLNDIGVVSIEAIGWLVPTLGSPDYYNSCSTQEVGVPQNLVGYQDAQDGKAFAGLLTSSTLSNYREYIAVEMKSELVLGKKYFWCLWVSLADSVSNASNNIGVALTENYLTFNHDQNININVYGNSEVVITQTNEWTKLSGSFLANGNEKYLYVGNFKDDFNTKIDKLHSSSLVGDLSYYYLDNIYLGELPCCPISIDLPNVFTPNNDGVNDSYKVRIEGIESAKVIIINRWGNTVFSGNHDEAWDGSFRGEKCSGGTYFITVKYFDYTLNRCSQKTGYIHLLR